MNILITGTSGFLSKEFIDYFSRYNIITCDRFKLLNPNYLATTVKENNVKIILHTSWAGVGSGTNEDLKFNLKVQHNLESCSNLVDKIFIFGSGAEFFSEVNNYVLGKKYVNQSSKKYTNIINLRLFGCFGKHENDSRFIKNSVSRIKKHSPVIINQDKRMDFFFVEDLCRVIEYCIRNKECPNLIDCVYEEKKTLTDIAAFLNDLFGLDPRNIQLESYNEGEQYIGDATTIESLNIQKIGLFEGIKKVYGKEAANFKSSK